MTLSNAQVFGLLRGDWHYPRTSAAPASNAFRPWLANLFASIVEIFGAKICAPDSLLVIAIKEAAAAHTDRDKQVRSGPVRSLVGAQ